jgi:hypothetical protein
MVSKSFSSLVLTLGVVAPLAGAVASTGCSSKFEGCASSRSCADNAGEGGDGGTAGKGGSAGQGGSAGMGTAGKGGSLSMGGEGGESSSSSGKGGTGGTAGSDNGGKGGQGGSSGSSTEPIGGEGGTEAEPEPDETAPTIISVSPDHGETGVSADTVIRITFSEPMDRAKAEAAYQSADIPWVDTTRRWSTDDTVLTITPNAELLYAEGAKNELAVPALQFAIEMTDTAEDKAGNRLVPKAWTFSTLRRLTQTLVADDDDVRRFNGTRNMACDSMALGDYPPLQQGGDERILAGFIQFRLGELVPGVTAFESASVAGERVANGDGDPRGLDGVKVYEFEGDIATVDLNTPTGPSLGVFLDSFADFPRLSILPALTSTYAEDGLVQLHLKAAPDGDGEADYYRLLCAFSLLVTYIAP